MEELHDTCLPYKSQYDKRTRDLIGTMVKAYWKALNEWTYASNIGLHHLKLAIGILVNPNVSEDLSREVHSECRELASALEVMKKTIKTMKSLQEELRKVIDLQEIARPGCTFEPIFSTSTPKRFYEIFVKTANLCSKETEIKIQSCKPLPFTTDADTLNTSITLWTNSSHLLQPHLFHIKILLHESQLL